VDAIIKDPNGQWASVNESHQLLVRAESLSHQHHQSHVNGAAFQASGHSATLSSGTNTVLHIKNNDPLRDMVVTYVRLQLVGSANGAYDSLTDCFELGTGRTLSSDGTAVTPFNMNRSKSSIVASVTATEGAGTNPTMAGTFLATGDRWYPNAAGDREKYNKEGTLILGLNDTLEIRYVGTHTAGQAYARVSFLMEESS